MIKALLCVIGVAVLILLGFALAMFFQWTTSISYEHVEQDHKIMLGADGEVISAPGDVRQTSFSFSTQPYREPPTFDLFDEDKKKGDAK